MVADMRALPFPDGSFASVLSVQSLEHVPDPERVLAEAARVLEPGGVAVFVTPNRLTLGRPDEIIDPYHHVEFDAGELRGAVPRALRRGRACAGCSARPRYMELFDEERRTLDRLLAAATRCGCAGRCPIARAPAPLRPAAAPRTGARTTRARRRSRPRTSSSRDGRARRGARPVRALLRAEAALTRACAWCGAPLGRPRAPPRRPRPLPGAAARRPPTPGRPGGARRAPTATGTGPRPAAASRSLGDALLRRTRAPLARRLDAIAPPGPVLDVGAGRRHADRRAAAARPRRPGLERDARAARHARRPLAEVDGDWAAVVFWHSLEHLPEPGAAVRDAARLLAPGGVVVVAVPERRQPPGARVRRPLAAPRPAAPPRPPHARGRSRRGSSAHGLRSSASRSCAAARS